MEPIKTKHLVRFTVDYSLYLDAMSENDAIQQANEVPLENWDKTVSQFEAEEA